MNRQVEITDHLQLPAKAGLIFVDHEGRAYDTHWHSQSVGYPQLCMRGTTTGHQHPQHTINYWNKYRGWPLLLIWEPDTQQRRKDA